MVISPPRITFLIRRERDSCIESKAFCRWLSEGVRGCSGEGLFGSAEVLLLVFHCADRGLFQDGRWSSLDRQMFSCHKLATLPVCANAAEAG